MSKRADNIYDILMAEESRRMRVRDILGKLRDKEKAEDLHASAVTTTVRSDNQSKDAHGEIPRFNHSGDGTEERGYISIREKRESSTNKRTSAGDDENSIPAIIEKANEAVKHKLKDAIKKLTWQEFENNFLEQILDALGFSSIQITQRTWDGGRDAECTYKRGLVNSIAIVSAKHWKRRNVGIEEVQRLRGLRGNADTGVIVTSKEFTAEAIKEAEPSQNQRAIVLIDIDILADVCFSKGIGVEKVQLQSFYKFTGLKDEELAPGEAA